MKPSFAFLILATSLAVSAIACKKRPVAPKPALVVLGKDAYTQAQRDEGRALAKTFECARCHSAKDKLEPVELARDCVGCHRQIIEGTFDAPKATLEQWHIRNLTIAPHLEGIDARIRAQWFVSYMLKPHDLRPRLGAMMPRFEINEAQAWALAAHFNLPKQARPSTHTGDPSRGPALITRYGCMRCHGDAVTSPVRTTDPTLSLAPSFGDVRQRMPQGALEQWIQDPKKLHPRTRMPMLGVPANDARDLAAYLSSAQLWAPSPKPPAFVRLPVLTRQVNYQEVHDAAFGVLCMHCHSDPDFNEGDGGPGNTGGFGFVPMGLDLSSEQGALWGVESAAGTEYSIIEPIDEQGTPRVVRHLLARHEEQSGRIVKGVRGMPMGHPALSAQQIQLIETWARQTWKQR